MGIEKIVLDLKTTEEETNRLIHERTVGQAINAELVLAAEVRKPEAYNRFRDIDKKAQFRARLLDRLSEQLMAKFPHDQAGQLIAQFKQLATGIGCDGALTLGDLISHESFRQLIDIYDSKLSAHGSQSWLHSYINFGNHPDFLCHPKFRDAFLHPLLLALMAYSVGGPIRMVDARGKDAEPLTVQAQDNMLHVDNTPFREEFKIILTWKQGEVSGPKGQNFVFIPGTQQGARNCKISSTGEAWSTEDGSIFTTAVAVDTIFALQERVLPGQAPTVVEVTHPDMPLTTLFRAGELVHHRYRTKEKNIPRSCVILAFHRAEDNPGQFLDSNVVIDSLEQGDLLSLLMGPSNRIGEDSFLNALMNNFFDIAAKLEQLATPQPGGTKILSYTQRKLDAEELQQWRTVVTSAPTVEAIKIKANLLKLGGGLSTDLLLEMMKYDKHGPLDLILYEDGHEEIRKWARNRIREMPLTLLGARLKQFEAWGLYESPCREDLLPLQSLSEISLELIRFIDALDVEQRAKGLLDKQEKITPIDAFRSIKQLISDLGEAIVRCTSRQTFLSTSLFLFWSCDELHRLLVGLDGEPLPTLLTLSKCLFKNYLATYVLIEKQIAQVNQKAPEIKVSAYPLHQFFASTSSFVPAKVGNDMPLRNGAGHFEPQI